MINPKFLAGILITGASIFVGARENDDAKKINQATESLKKRCDSRISKARSSITDKSKTLRTLLSDFGNLRKSFCENVLLHYNEIICSKYKHYNVIFSYESDYNRFIFDRNLDYKTLRKQIELINKNPKTEISKSKIAIATALGTTGIVTVASAIGAKAALPTILGSSILGTAPVVGGIAYGILGFTNKRNAIQYQNEVREYQQKVDNYIAKAHGLLKRYDDLDAYLNVSYDKVKIILLNFCEALRLFEKYTEKKLTEMKKSKINVRHLTDSEFEFLYDIWVLSQIAYGSINLTMCSSKCLIDEDSKTKLEEYGEASKKLLIKLDGKKEIQQL